MAGLSSCHHGTPLRINQHVAMGPLAGYRRLLVRFGKPDLSFEVWWKGRQVNTSLGWILEKRCVRRIAESRPRKPSAVLSNPTDTVEHMADIAGGIVALGKFDALHIGHRALAEHASQMGPPWMLSFAGMAEVLGWEPRLPLVAASDRRRVMNLWAPWCGGMIPREFRLDFQRVRKLSPEDFVKLLAMELRVKGVVAGGNYRFGFKAMGDAGDLERLGRQYGLPVQIVEAVLDNINNGVPGGIERKVDSGYISGGSEMGQVSSSQVRRALSCGDVERVAGLLGRRHRVVVPLSEVRDSQQVELKQKGNRVEDNERERERERESIVTSLLDVEMVRELVIPQSALTNQPPTEGIYSSQVILYGQDMGVEPWTDTRIGAARVEIYDKEVFVIFEQPLQRSELTGKAEVALEF